MIKPLVENNLLLPFLLNVDTFWTRSLRFPPMGHALQEWVRHSASPYTLSWNWSMIMVSEFLVVVQASCCYQYTSAAVGHRCRFRELVGQLWVSAPGTCTSHLSSNLRASYIAAPWNRFSLITFSRTCGGPGLQIRFVIVLIASVRSPVCALRCPEVGYFINVVCGLRRTGHRRHSA